MGQRENDLFIIKSLISDIAEKKEKEEKANEISKKIEYLDRSNEVLLKEKKYLKHREPLLKDLNNKKISCNAFNFKLLTFLISFFIISGCMFIDGFLINLCGIIGIKIIRIVLRFILVVAFFVVPIIINSHNLDSVDGPFKTLIIIMEFWFPAILIVGFPIDMVLDGAFSESVLFNSILTYSAFAYVLTYIVALQLALNTSLRHRFFRKYCYKCNEKLEIDFRNSKEFDDALSLDLQLIQNDKRELLELKNSLNIFETRINDLELNIKDKSIYVPKPYANVESLISIKTILDKDDSMTMKDAIIVYQTDLISERENDLQKVKEDLSKAIDDIVSLRKEHIALINRYNSVVSENNALSQKVTALDSEISYLQKENDSLGNYNYSLSRDIDDIQSKIRDLENEIDD